MAILKLIFEHYHSTGPGKQDKTYRKVLQNFYWFKKRCQIVYQSCHAHQVVGKPNQNRHSAPLRPIPAFAEPFSQVIVDCVGPLPKA